MKYTPSLLPLSDIDKMWLSNELQKIALAINSERWTKRFSEPSNPKDGDVAFADGIKWNPGSGEGAYIFYNNQWNYLG